MSQFNSWYIVLPLLMVASFTLGRLNIRHNHRNQKVQRLHGAPLFAVSLLWGIGCAALLGWLICVESLAGLIELLGRSNQDAPIYAALIIAAICMTVGVIQFTTMYVVAGSIDEPVPYYCSYRRQSRTQRLLARFTGCRRGGEQILKRFAAYRAKRSVAKATRILASATHTTSGTAAKSTSGTRTTAGTTSGAEPTIMAAPRQRPVPVQEAVDAAARPETYILAQIEYEDFGRTIQALIKSGAELDQPYFVLAKVRSERVCSKSSNILDFEERYRRWRSAQ